MFYLFKRKHFITEKIYTTSNGLVSDNIKELIDKLNDEDVVICDTREILYDIMREIKYDSIKIINSNADILVGATPIDMLKENTLILTIGFYHTEEHFINQIAFINNGNKLRIGVLT